MDRPQKRDGRGPFTEPRTSSEELVAHVFADLLRLDRVGAHDDFFELGGHSLLTNQVVARLARSTGVDLSLQAVFEAPTVEELARRLDRTGGSAVPGEFPRHKVGARLRSSIVRTSQQ